MITDASAALVQANIEAVTANLEVIAGNIALAEAALAERERTPRGRWRRRAALKAEVGELIRANRLLLAENARRQHENFLVLA